MSKYQCGVCGTVVEGTEPPAQCPICKAPSEYFNLISDQVIPDWASVNPDGGTGNTSVEVTVLANTSRSSRNGALYIKTASDLTKTVVMTQQGRDPINIIVGGSGGYLTKLTI